MPTGLTPRHDSVDLGADDLPDFLPAFPAGLTERTRMFVFPDTGSICVVVKLKEVIAPPQKHGVPRCKHGVHDDEQCFGPGFDGPD
jgi:hypothetical protein